MWKTAVQYWSGQASLMCCREPCFLKKKNYSYFIKWKHTCARQISTIPTASALSFVLANKMRDIVDPRKKSPSPLTLQKEDWQVFAGGKGTMTWTLKDGRLGGFLHRKENPQLQCLKNSKLSDIPGYLSNRNGKLPNQAILFHVMHPSLGNGWNKDNFTSFFA